LKALVNQIEESCGTPEEIKRQIDDTVETVKARRDGLFNASALSETRNSNHLGQNVKLLTYVSIFYLPLAFCAAVWAIPNIDMSGTKTAFSVTALVLG
jgi:Mg2+ and Co2+ transporter CorA